MEAIKSIIRERIDNLKNMEGAFRKHLYKDAYYASSNKIQDSITAISGIEDRINELENLLERIESE